LPTAKRSTGIFLGPTKNLHSSTTDLLHQPSAATACVLSRSSPLLLPLSGTNSLWTQELLVL